MINTNTNIKETGSYDFDSVSEKSFQIKENSNPNQIFQILKIKNKKKWTKDEDLQLIKLAEKHKEKHWKEISRNFQNKNALQCFSRYKRIRPGIVKGSWKKEEDEKILKLVQIYGKSWSKISKILVTRNGKQIRDRFINVLDPEIKKGKFTEQEDKLLIRLYLYYGPKWATISKHYTNRTADMIKNRFHSSIKKTYFMDNGMTIKRNFNPGNLKLNNLNSLNSFTNLNLNTSQENVRIFLNKNIFPQNSFSSNVLFDENLPTNSHQENVNMIIDDEFGVNTEKCENFSKIRQIKQNNRTKKIFDSNNKFEHKMTDLISPQNISQNITNTQTFSFCLENMSRRQGKFIDEEISDKFREETHLTPEDLEKIKEFKEMIEYKENYFSLNENNICNTNSNNNVNDNLYLNDDYNLIHIKDDGDFSPEDNYANLFHFEDYFSI